MAHEINKFTTTPFVFHGPGSLSRLTEEVRKLGGKRIGIVTDAGIVKAGIKDEVVRSLEQEAVSFDEVLPEPPIEIVDRCVAFVRENGCDLLIGLGGGSSMDTAKMAAALITNPGKVTDYFGVDLVPKPGIPVIAIPTTAGTGSEVSTAAVFLDTEAQAKKGLRSDHLLPRLAILDPELTVSLPKRLTASTGIDALTHAIEGYTNTISTLMSELMAEKAIELIEKNLRAAYANGKDISARYGMLMGSYVSGINLAIASVNVVHALAHTLGGTYRIAHGVANSLFLPYVMEFNRISCREKFAKVASLLGEDISGLSPDEASSRAVGAVRKLIRDLDIPQHLSELDIPKEAIDVIPKRCMETQARLIALNPTEAGLEELKQIVEEAY